MKRLILILVLPAVIIAVYLLFSYTRMYKIIGEKDLKSPYKERRIVMENLTQQGAIKYVALGDSLSAGVGSSRIEETYPYLFALKLSEKYNKVEFINLAYSGDQTQEVLSNQLEPAVKEKPDYITLMIGINDMHNRVPEETFINNYKTILNRLLSDTTAKIIVINIPYLASDKLVYPPYDDILDLKTRQYNEYISSVSKHERIKFIDLYESVDKNSRSQTDYYSTDFFHPSGTGYVLWSKIINED